MKKKLLTLRPQDLSSDRQTDWQEFVPLPESARDRVSLEHHVQLEALRTGAGSLTSLQTLMRVVLASALLRHLGYGDILPATVEDYEALARKSMDAGCNGTFQFGEATFGLFAFAVLAFDEQLKMAPLKALRHVEDKLAHFARASAS